MANLVTTTDDSSSKNKTIKAQEDALSTNVIKMLHFHGKLDLSHHLNLAVGVEGQTVVEGNAENEDEPRYALIKDVHLPPMGKMLSKYGEFNKATAKRFFELAFKPYFFKHQHDPHTSCCYKVDMDRQHGSKKKPFKIVDWLTFAPRQVKCHMSDEDRAKVLGGRRAPRGQGQGQGRA